MNAEAIANEMFEKITKKKIPTGFESGLENMNFKLEASNLRTSIYLHKSYPIKLNIFSPSIKDGFVGVIYDGTYIKFMLLKEYNLEFILDALKQLIAKLDEEVENEKSKNVGMA